MGKNRDDLTRRHRRRWMIAAAGVFAAALLICLGGQPFITRQVEGRLKEELQEHGLSATWKRSSWSPWQGMRMEDLSIRQQTGSKRPVAELQNVAIRFSLLHFAGDGERVTHWSIRNARVKLYDSEGGVSLEQVSLKMKGMPGKVILQKFTARNDGLIADLSGSIFFNQDSTAEKPFELDLSAVRGTLSTLDVRNGTGPFKVMGDFSIDARSDQSSWNARLKGTGENLEWKGILLRHATAEASLSAEDSRIDLNLQMPKGLTKASLSRTGWSGTPFRFHGTVVDSTGRVNGFNGFYQNQALVVDHMSGSANLWELAGNVPRLKEKLPAGWNIHDFPPIQLDGLRAEFSSQPVRWEIESVKTDGPAALSMSIHKGDLKVTGLTGSASRQGETWMLDDIQGKALGGSIAFSGSYREGVLSDSRVRMDSVKLSEVKKLAGVNVRKANPGVIDGSYRGDLNPAGKKLNGSGSLRLENAPVFEVPLLEPVYDLFAAMLPGVERADKGKFEIEFTARSQQVEITRFEASGGSLTVSAVGTANLKTERVAGKARGKLTGLPGVLTSPLSRLLEMEVGGPFDDIRVKPLGPAKLASNAASATVGTAVDAMEEAGNITGDIIKEGIKAPLRWFQKDE